MLVRHWKGYTLASTVGAAALLIYGMPGRGRLCFYLGKAAGVDELMRAVVEHHSYLRERGGHSIVKSHPHAAEIRISRE